MKRSILHTALEKNGFVKLREQDHGLSVKCLSMEILEEIREIELSSLPHVQAKDLGEYINGLHKIDVRSGSKSLSQLYKVLPGLPSLWRFASNQTLLNIIKKELSLKSVSLGTVPLVRLDRPSDEHFSTPWHQDFWFSQSSEDSIVIWFPLTTFTEDMGYLKAIPKPSEYGIVKFREHKDGHEPYEPAEPVDDNKSINLDCNFGDVLIFKQSLLHASGKNISEKVRVSCQLRFNKMHNQKEGFSTFTAVHSEFVLDGQKKYMVD